MPRRYKEARKKKSITLIAAAKMLGVTQPTLSSWESERYSPSPDTLECMADLYGVTTDYLLGRDVPGLPPMGSLQPVSPAVLGTLHGQAAWSDKYGWTLIDTTEKCLITIGYGAVPYADAGTLYLLPPAFSVGYHNLQEPMTLSEIKRQTKTWIEPISPDAQLRAELRGWYQIRDRYVESEFGHRFYLDTYGVKWLAFDSELD